MCLRIKLRSPVPIGIRHGKVSFLPCWLLQNWRFHRKVEVFPVLWSRNLHCLGDGLLFSSFETSCWGHSAQKFCRALPELLEELSTPGSPALTTVLTLENVLGSSGMTDACVCTCNMLLIIRADWIFSTNYTGYEVSPFFRLTSGSQNTVKAYF